MLTIFKEAISTQADKDGGDFDGTSGIAPVSIRMQRWASKKSRNQLMCSFFWLRLSRNSY